MNFFINLWNPKILNEELFFLSIENGTVNYSSDGVENRLLKELIKSPKLITTLKKGEIPIEFYCPITLKIMVDPVTTSCGSTYNKEAITQWLSKNEIDPLTKVEITNTLYPNLAVSAFIEASLKLFHIQNCYPPRPKMETIQNRGLGINLLNSKGNFVLHLNFVNCVLRIY